MRHSSAFLSVDTLWGSAVTRILKWVLAPVKQWRTRRLSRAHGPSLSPSAAWCLVMLAHDPAELPLVRSLVIRKNLGVPPGVSLDVWAQLAPAEQHRRIVWLRRHGATPLYLLGVPEELIELAGLHVVEWALPPGLPLNSIVAQNRLPPKE